MKIEIFFVGRGGRVDLRDGDAFRERASGGCYVS